MEAWQDWTLFKLQNNVASHSMWQPRISASRWWTVRTSRPAVT